MQPLQGITVVAVEQAVAAPFATRQLADLGARVMGPIPALAEHRQAIREELGFDRTTIARWHTEGVI